MGRCTIFERFTRRSCACLWCSNCRGTRGSPGAIGVSLVPLLDSPGEDRPVFAHTQRHLSDKATLLDGDWKLIYGWAGGREESELYRLSDDPGEKQNLMASEPEVAARREAVQLEEHLRQT